MENTPLNFGTSKLTDNQKKLLLEIIERKKQGLSKTAAQDILKCVCPDGLYGKLEKATKEEYLRALAAPKWNRLLPYPNPKFEVKLPIPVNPATLTGPVPQRIHALAVPKIRLSDWPKQKPPAKPKPAEDIDMKRIEELAKPKPRFRAVHERCMEPVRRPAKKTLKNDEDWVRHNRWLQTNAVPRVRRWGPAGDSEAVALVTGAKSRRKLTRKQVEEMANRLSVVPESKKRKPKSDNVTRPMVHYVSGNKEDFDWVNRLSKPRVLSEETKLDIAYDPSRIPKAALRAKASERTKELAQPRKQSIAQEQELKANAFQVSPLALKYKATKRIKELAKPKRLPKGW